MPRTSLLSFGAFFICIGSYSLSTGCRVWLDLTFESWAPPNIPVCLLYNTDLFANSHFLPFKEGMGELMPCWGRTGAMLSRDGPWRLSNVSGRHGSMPTLLLCFFLLHKDSSCWEGSSQTSEDNSRCFIPASQFSIQALPIPCLWEDCSPSAVSSSLIRIGCIVPASQVIWGWGLRCKAQVCLQWVGASLSSGLTIPVQDKWWNIQANLWGDGGKHPILKEGEEEEKSSLFLELPNVRAREAQTLWFLMKVPQAHLRTSERNLRLWFNSAELN